MDYTDYIQTGGFSIPSSDVIFKNLKCPMGLCVKPNNNLHQRKIQFRKDEDRETHVVNIDFLDKLIDTVTGDYNNNYEKIKYNLSMKTRPSKKNTTRKK
jgi:hypothetical protein